MAAASPRCAHRAIRPLDEQRQIHALTGLRGVAALWVLLCHAWNFFGAPVLQVGPLDLTRLLSLGWIGVLVFFVLSGFLLTQPYATWRRGLRARPDTGRYLLHRLFRVLPAYYLQLAVLLLVLWLSGAAWSLQSAWQVLGHLLLLFNIGDPPVLPLVGSWWTLTVEFGYYLALPLLAALMTRRSPWPMLLVAVAISGLDHYLGWLWLHDQPINTRSQFVTQLPGYLVVFALGSAGAWYAAGDQQLLRRRGLANALAATGVIALGGLMAWIPLEDGGARFWNSPLLYGFWKPLVALAILALVLSCLATTSVLAQLLASRPMRWLGDISYSVYLWHLPIILWLTEPALAQWLGAPGQWLLAVAATLAVAQLSARWVERPFIALGRRCTSGRQGRDASGD